MNQAKKAYQKRAWKPERGNFVVDKMSSVVVKKHARIFYERWHVVRVNSACGVPAYLAEVNKVSFCTKNKDDFTLHNALRRTEVSGAIGTQGVGAIRQEEAIDFGSHRAYQRQVCSEDE